MYLLAVVCYSVSEKFQKKALLFPNVRGKKAFFLVRNDLSSLADSSTIEYTANGLKAGFNII